MTNQPTQGRVDRQYLKAMGIDLWADRGAEVAVSHSDAIKQAAPVVQQATANTALAEISAAELPGVVAGIRIARTDKLPHAPLLVVTDGPGLTDDSHQLLGSMLKAIELENSQWLHAAIAEGDGTEDVSTVEKSMAAKVVLIMLRTGGNTTALKQLRGIQHQCAALQSRVFVTFHPQDLLDNPKVKRPAWEDLKQLRQWLA